MNSVRLGVNIDHIATLRNARGVSYPCPVEGALVCQRAGADGITLHLREDRRHIKDADVYAIKQAIGIPMNLEMATTDEMLAIACDVRPHWVCIVPEKREEITTEGGLDVVKNHHLPAFIKTLQANGIKVSLFIDPDTAQVNKSIELGADAIELHTGAYATYGLQDNQSALTEELKRLKAAIVLATAQPNFIVNAGHGLTYDNVAPIVALGGIYELNIGHSLIADGLFLGLEQSVKRMKQRISE